MNDFYLMTLHPAALLPALMILIINPQTLLNFPLHNHTIYKKIFLFFPIFVSYISFSYFIVLDTTSSMIQHRGSDSQHPCLAD